MNMIKYPRTRHIVGSEIQTGDHDLKTASLSELKNRSLVIEEKVDGANSGISFDKNGELFLQSRGHFLTSGYRERHFNLFKTWAQIKKFDLFELLSDKYIMYGEWLYAKHTVFYDALPHYFLEFDIYDKENKIFFSTEERRKFLKDYDFIKSVPVIYEGQINSCEELENLIAQSLYKTADCMLNFIKLCESKNLDVERALTQTDSSNLAEGLYIKDEENGVVVNRYKFVRNDFVQQIQSNDDHWLDRPIIENLLAGGGLDWG